MSSSEASVAGALRWPGQWSIVCSPARRSWTDWVPSVTCAAASLVSALSVTRRGLSEWKVTGAESSVERKG